MSYIFNQAFSERLQFYGVQEPLQERILIDKETVWDDHSSPFMIKVIKTSDLDEIKRLIGIDDKYLEDNSIGHPGMKLAMGLKEVTIDTTQLAASAYVFGNSRALKHLKSGIEKIIGQVPVQLAASTELVIDNTFTVDEG